MMIRGYQPLKEIRSLALARLVIFIIVYELLAGEGCSFHFFEESVELV